METEKSDNTLFIHSRCCNAHWELVFFPDAGRYRLECEKCGKEATPLRIIGPVMEHQCSECKPETE